MLSLCDELLWRSSAGEANDASVVTSPEDLVLLLERYAALLGILGLAHDLQPDTNGLSVCRCSNIVEDELSQGSTIVYATSESYLLGGVRLAGLEVSKLGDKVVRIVCDLEPVRVGVGVVGGEESVDLSASQLVVLTRVEVLLACGGGLLRGGLGRGGSSLGLLLLLLLALLLTTLELGLGDLVESEMSV